MNNNIEEEKKNSKPLCKSTVSLLFIILIILLTYKNVKIGFISIIFIFMFIVYYVITDNPENYINQKIEIKTY
jgi:hypothetical protein